MKLILASLLFFAIGSIPYSFLIGKYLGGIDIRKEGSKNTGATNVARLCGTKYGIMALILDMTKGAAAALLAYYFGIPIILSGLAVIGHNWSPFLLFSGGKGVATTLGLLSAISWPTFLITISLWGIIVHLTSFVSVGSMTAIILSPLVIYLFEGSFWSILLMLMLGILTIFQHRGNISRLLKGEENKLRLGG